MVGVLQAAEFTSIEDAEGTVEELMKAYIDFEQRYLGRPTMREVLTRMSALHAPASCRAFIAVLPQLDGEDPHIFAGSRP